jgi:hypothetical protein
VGKHHSNPQYFKGKQLQSEIFNQLNIKKSKIDKDNFGKNKQKKKKNGESWKKKVILEKKINAKKGETLGEKMKKCKNKKQKK